MANHLASDEKMAAHTASKMDSLTTSKSFISSLARHLQDLCSGCIEFEKYILVTGQLVVSVDACEHRQYVINEKLFKTGDSVSVMSNSFPSQTDFYEGSNAVVKVSVESDNEMESKPAVVDDVVDDDLSSHTQDNCSTQFTCPATATSTLSQASIDPAELFSKTKNVSGAHLDDFPPSDEDKASTVQTQFPAIDFPPLTPKQCIVPQSLQSSSVIKEECETLEQQIASAPVHLENVKGIICLSYNFEKCKIENSD